MTNNEIVFKDRTLLVMLITMIVAWAVTISMFSVIQQLTIEEIIAESFAGAIFISVVLGFSIYKQRFRDERTMNIMDKAGRNGFLPSFYILPLAVIYFSLTGATLEVVSFLVGLWLLSVVVFAVTAVYHYQR